MLTITIQVNAPAELAQGVKEDLAMYLERYGDARVVEGRAEGLEQMGLWKANKAGGRKWKNIQFHITPEMETEMTLKNM